MSRLHGLLLLSLVATDAALAEPAAHADPAPQEKKICRTEGSSESRISRRRRCLTREEWQAVDEAAAKDAKRMVGEAIGIRGTTRN